MSVSGEWEISAFDGSLKSRGMSIRYTVRPCDNGDLPLVDRNDDEDDISDYFDELYLQPRSRRTQNRTVLCRKLLANHTQSVNTSSQNVTDDKIEVTGAEQQSGCQQMLEGGIPEDILEEIEMDEEQTASQNMTEPEREGAVRQRRHAEGSGTDVDKNSGASEDKGTGIEIEEQAAENRNDTDAEIKTEGRSGMSSVKNETEGELEESNEILQPNSNPLFSKKISSAEPNISEEVDRNYIQSEPERLRVDQLDLEYNNTADNNNTRRVDLSLEYDDYSQEVLFLVYIRWNFVKCV